MSLVEMVRRRSNVEMIQVSGCGIYGVKSSIGVP